MQKRNKNFILIGMIFLFFLLAGIFVFFFASLETHYLDVRFEVSDRLGVEGNNSVLTFGRVIPESVSTRRISITNHRDYPVRALLDYSSNAGDFLYFEREVFIGPNGNYSLPVILKVSQNASFGKYFGRLRIKIFKYR